MKLMLKLLMILWVPFLGGCVFSTNNSTLAGGGDVSGTGNARVKGIVTDSSHRPILGGTIHLRPTRFLAPIPSVDGSMGGPKNVTTSFSSVDATTDNLGRIDLGKLLPGKYRIEIFDSNSQKGKSIALVIDIELTSDASLDLGTLVARPVAVLKGNIGTKKLLGTTRYLQVEGLERLIKVAPSGDFIVNNLPAGIFSIHISDIDTVTGAVSPSVIIAEGLRLLAGQEQTINTQAGWKYSRRIYFNTTNNGANVSETLFNFPVLLRLDTANFSFEKARELGQDIQFINGNGNPLPFEIESWDTVQKQAAIWVKVDTLLGNNNLQYITLIWGNTTVLNSLSNSSAVFDTANGFAAVWHLNGIQKDLFQDATYNQNDGKGILSSSYSSGMIAGSQIFNGTSDVIHCEPSTSLELDSVITVSAWVLATDTVARRYNRILSKKTTPFSADGYDFECSPKFEPASNPDGQFTLVGANSGYARAFTPWTRSWHYLAITAKGTSTKFYFDGQEVFNVFIPYNPFQSSKVPLLIGGAAWGDFFNGALDEIRIMRTVQTPAWIRMSYENQKSIQSLVEFK